MEDIGLHKEIFRIRLVGLFHMAAKGWINVQCQLHIKSTQYKTNNNY